MSTRLQLGLNFVGVAPTAVAGRNNVETVRFRLARGCDISRKAFKERGCRDLNQGLDTIFTRGLFKDRTWLMGALYDLAKEKVHFKVLQFLNMLPSTFGKDCVKIEEDRSTGIRAYQWDADEGDDVEPSEERILDGVAEPFDKIILDDVAESYHKTILGGVAEERVEKILADFETGTSDEVISIHFHIEFPVQLVNASCKKGYLGILQFLGESGGLDFNLLKDKDVGGWQDNGEYHPEFGYPLHTAAFCGHVNIVTFLLERGYSVDSLFTFRDCSPLQRAVASGKEPEKKLEIAAILLDAGADPGYRDNGGYTAMHMVYGKTSRGSRDLVRLLVEAGFDCGEENRWGEDYMDVLAQIRTIDEK